MLSTVREDRICHSSKKEGARLLPVVWDHSLELQRIWFWFVCSQMVHFLLNKEEITLVSSMQQEEFQLRKVSQVFGKVAYLQLSEPCLSISVCSQLMKNQKKDYPQWCLINWDWLGSLQVFLLVVLLQHWVFHSTMQRQSCKHRSLDQMDHWSIRIFSMQWLWLRSNKVWPACG